MNSLILESRIQIEVSICLLSPLHKLYHPNSYQDLFLLLEAPEDLWLKFRKSCRLDFRIFSARSNTLA